MDTIFDRIIAKKIPAKIVYEDEHALAFEDINPKAPVHVLVIPKHRWSFFSELGEADPLKVGQYLATVSKVAKQLGLNESGYRIVFNNGKDAEQSVDYLHAHILGKRHLNWPPG